MWDVNDKTEKLQMAEGDYGIELPVTVHGTTLGENDTLLFTFKAALNGATILTKEYGNPTDNTVNLEFTEAESALFGVGDYVYSLDWYQSGSFMCNLIRCAVFVVVDKA